MNFVIPMLAITVLSSTAVWMVRRYAIARSVLDLPNHRSSHRTPTPRGGGLGMVMAFFVGLMALALTRIVDPRTALALIIGAGAIATIGFLDDHGAVDWKLRLLVQVCAAAAALSIIGGMPQVSGLGFTLKSGIVANALAVLGLVWLCNLYNFMDGIDGLAAAESVTTCIGMLVVYAQLSTGTADPLLAGLLAAATAGFLIWNFPRARIFMGDVGSGFLGFTLGLLAIRAARETPSALWSWLILLGVFVVDASVTLLRRAARGSRLHEAHREHAYQHLAVRLGSHVPVTMAVVAINLAWLLPWAVVAALHWLDPVVVLGVALVPLITIALPLGAGAPARER